MPTIPTTTAESIAYCKAEVTDAADALVYRCTRPTNHDGPHGCVDASGRRITWWSE